MKISCPKCNATGTIPDHEIPEIGRFVSCPRCNEGFTVNKPRSGNDLYLVDTCPSCGFSTYGDESFGSCPKCGIEVKTYVERQKEEQRLKHNNELLGKRFNNNETAPLSPEVSATSVADFIDNLHPVNLIGWGVAAAAIIVLGLGLWGIIGYDSTGIHARLMKERDEPVSSLYVFMHYGFVHWIRILWGMTALAVSMLFMKRLKMGLRVLRALIWATIALVSLSYVVGFVYWVLAPIPHSLSGYLIEIVNILFMSALVGIPLYLLESYLHERKITALVNL